MITKSRDCVGCPSHMGCSRPFCPYYDSLALVCDKCKDEFDELYEYDGTHLCEDCLKKEFTKITYDNAEDFI